MKEKSLKRVKKRLRSLGLQGKVEAEIFRESLRLTGRTATRAEYTAAGYAAAEEVGPAAFMG